MGPFYSGCEKQLTLYVRHRAWLAARPGKGKDRVSRLERFLADEEAGKVRSELVSPPLDAAEHLVDHLFAIGPATAGEAITFQEIRAWTEMTGHVLNGWEAETIRRLSGVYLAEYQAAEEGDRPSPFTPAERVVSREEVSRRLLEAFTRMAAQDQGKVATED